MPPFEEIIRRNLDSIRRRIAEAAERSGRAADAVRLIAVTKYVGLDEIRALHAAGCRDFGESRPQDLWEKVEMLRDLPLNWHLIGHLQRNKVRRTLPLVSLLHSGDSLAVLEAVNRLGGEIDRHFNVLIEVNISGDENKHGFRAAEVAEALPRIAEMNNVSVKGLMAMASREGGIAQARKDFENVRALRERLVEQDVKRIGLSELSMGMSDDFEAAIEQGATMVRIGSALFEESTA